MNPGDTPQEPSFEEFMHGIQETQAELEHRRQLAWVNALKEINQVLDNANYEPDSPMRASLFNIMQMLWIKGYNRGARDMSDYIARSAGMGPVLDMMKLAESQFIQKPENN